MHPLSQHLRALIDLDKVQSNYKNLCAFTQTPMASVLKANAYGLGAARMAQALHGAGCQQFFVATVGEAIELRSVLPKHVPIYLLHGCFAEEIKEIQEYNLTPVLSNLSQLELWTTLARKEGKPLPALLHFDTGMNRFGFDARDVEKVLAHKDALDIQYVMSHLACADNPENPYNKQQRDRFLEIIKHFPGEKYSLAASEGIGLGSDYAFDLIRAGISFYGIIPYAPHTEFAVKAQAQIIQTRTLAPGESIGYGQHYKADSQRRIGTIAMGFADGLPCNATNQAHVYIGNYQAPVIGRVSMDLTVIDLTDIPENVAHETIWVDLFYDNVSHLKLAKECNMRLYEVTCNIGRRHQKIYIHATDL